MNPKPCKEQNPKQGWRIGFVEDEKIYRQHFKRSLARNKNIRSLRFWTSAELYLNDEYKGELDLLYVDIMLPHMSGLDLIAKLREIEPDLKIAIISSMNSDEIIFRALRLGAVGYVYKDELNNLGNITAQILAGGASISPTIALKVLNSFHQSNSELPEPLTEREKQVLELLARGQSAKKVAETLGISENTLRNHTTMIYRKLNINNRAQLVAKATELGVI